METDEAGRDTLMALAARADEICRSDRRVRVGGRQNVVIAVAIPAVRCFHVAERRDLRMERVEIGCVFLLVTVPAGR